MASGTLRELWERELRDLHSTEQKIISALPELIGAATSPDLKASLDRHLQRTKVHLERLDLVFKQCGFGTTAAPHPSGIESLVRAGAELVKINDDVDVRDAAIIAAAQHVEHYEMAGYGCARTWARQLGEDRAADLLQQTLDEEGAADKQLTDLAQSGINESASAGARAEGPMRSRLRYVDIDDLGAADRYRGTRVHNRSGEALGTVDGFIVDASGRPYYVVVDSGGLFVGRRYVVPVGRAEFRRGDRAFIVDLDKDTFKRYPEFHRDAFMSMNDDEARRYEWRVLEAIDPAAARSSMREWDYDRYPYYRQPDWFDRSVVTPGSGRAPSAPSRSREVPVVEGGERERVVAREEPYTTAERSSDTERVRGRSSDER